MIVESRTKKSFQNIKISLFFYVVNLLIQFVSRKVFIECLGSEVLGLNTTAQNLLGFLNIAELGIGSAVAYNLYKPLFDKDYQSINSIVSIQGWLYRKVAMFVIVGAVVLMFFFPVIFDKAKVPMWYTYGSFLALLVSALLSYFVNYKQIVLTADQKEYKITYCVQGGKVLKVLFQILAIRYFDNGYLWWIVIEVLMSFFTSYILTLTIKKEYNWLVTDVNEGKKLKNNYPDILIKTKQVFFHKIGSFVLNQSTPLIVYAFTSLSLVAIYGNYLLIVSGTTLLVNSILNSFNAGIGNLVAEGNIDKIKSVYWEISSFRLWVASLVCFGIYSLCDDFIRLWVGDEFLLSKVTILILVANTFLSLIRNNDAFISAYGLFHDTWAPIAEAILNIGFAISLGYFFNLPGILFGAFISSLIIIHIWKPLFLFKEGFGCSISEYIIRYFKYGLLIFLSVAFTYIINNRININVDSYLQWMFEAIIFVSVYCIISIAFFYSFDKSFRLCLSRFKINKKI